LVAHFQQGLYDYEIGKTINFPAFLLTHNVHVSRFAEPIGMPPKSGRTRHVDGSIFTVQAILGPDILAARPIAVVVKRHSILAVAPKEVVVFTNPQQRFSAASLKRLQCST
jgi:hypothetical protein